MVKRRPVPIRHPALVFLGFWGFLACFAGGAFLGISEHGRPLVPGAFVLWAPAGLLAIAAAAPSLANRPERIGGAIKGRRGALVVLAAGMAQFGVGMARLTDVTAFRVLALPAIAAAGVCLLRELVRRPSRSIVFSGVRRRSGSLRMWTAYLGAWVIVLVTPVGVAWSLGLITVR